MISRKCEICDIDVRRASYLKHLRSKEHLKNDKPNEMIFQSGYLKKLLKINKYIYNSKSLRQIARDIFHSDDKQLNKELAKKLINPYYFSVKKFERWIQK